MFDLDLRGVWDRIRVEILELLLLLLNTYNPEALSVRTKYPQRILTMYEYTMIRNGTYVRRARCALTFLFHTLVCKPCQPRRTLLGHYMVALTQGRSSTGSSPIRILWTPIDSDSGTHIRVDVFRLGAGPDRDQPKHAEAATPKQAEQATATQAKPAN